MKKSTFRNIVAILTWIALSAILIYFAATIENRITLPKAVITERIAICSGAAATVALALNIILFGATSHTPLDHLTRLGIIAGFASAVWNIYLEYVAPNSNVVTVLWIGTGAAAIYIAGILLAYIMAIADSMSKW